MDQAVVKQAIGLQPRDAIAFMRGKGATARSAITAARCAIVCAER